MGRSVLVLEKHPSAAGGGLHCFPLSGQSLPSSVQFDSGLHYTIPQSRQLLALACGAAAPLPDFAPLNGEQPAAALAAGFERVFFDDGAADIDPTRPSLTLSLHEGHLDELRRRATDPAALEAALRVTASLNSVSVPLYIVSKLLPRAWQPLYHRLFMADFHRWAATSTETALQRLLPGDKWLQAAMCSLWINSGTPPHHCSFVLAAAIQRGLPLQGGAYPLGGPSAVARALVSAVERHSGRVYIGAHVTDIVQQSGTAVGVRVVAGSSSDEAQFIAADTVVSAIGWRATNALLRRSEPAPPASDSFVMCNVVVRGSGSELGVSSANTWVHPVHDGDLFAGVRRYYQQPEAAAFPALITWPSLKNRADDSGLLTCQILVPVATDWFLAPFGDVADRQQCADYQAVKQRWRQRCVQLLQRYFPAVTAERIVAADVATPLSVRDWLNTDCGSAVGLSPTADRFAMHHVATFDCRSDAADNLWLTGQDVLLMGVPMCQLAGAITAFRIAGFFNTVKFIVRSILHL